MSDGRMLERAEGVLIALRGCEPDAAYAEIVTASKRHRVSTLAIATALVALAANLPSDGDATAAARFEWFSLLKH